MKSLLYSFLVLIFAVTFVACGGGGSDSETEETTEASIEVTMSVEETIRPVGEEMKYEVDTLTVATGTELTLILENTATLPTMVHNVVILTTGVTAPARSRGRSRRPPRCRTAAGAARARRSMRGR